MLSVQQPWAWLIMYCGKDVENRRWATTYRGVVAIHASLALDRDFTSGRFPLPAGVAVPALESLPRGAIVGIVSIVDCVRTSESAWFSGPFGFVLRDAHPLEPVPWRGALGLRRLPDETARLVWARADRARATSH